MARHAIEVSEVSKRYVLGEDFGGSRTLRETLTKGVRGLSQRRRSQRKEIWSLKDVTLDVDEGEAIGLIGRNGAGKSTLLKVLSRITEPTSGVSRTRGRLGSLLEVGTGFHPELTGKENVFLNGAILGMGRRAVAARYDEIVEFAGVQAFLDTPIKRYSSGMYLRLAFAVAAHLDADVLLVDEVLAVGDADFQRKCLQRMASVEREGRTVVFVSHNLDAIVRLCKRTVWLEAGRVRTDGPSQEVMDEYLRSAVQQMERRTFEEQVDQPVSLTSITLKDPQGRASSFLQRAEPFIVEVSFVVRDSVAGLDVTASVQNLRGLRVLDEAWSETMPGSLLSPGTYCARLTIPPVLNVGDYTVSVWLGTIYETFAWVDEAVTFRLEGTVDGRPDRVMQLGLPWLVHPTEPSGAVGDPGQL